MHFTSVKQQAAHDACRRSKSDVAVRHGVTRASEFGPDWTAGSKHGVGSMTDKKQLQAIISNIFIAAFLLNKYKSLGCRFHAANFHHFVRFTGRLMRLDKTR